MIGPTKLIDEIISCSFWKVLFVFLLKFEIVISIQYEYMSNTTNNYSCYTCIEPLVGYTDHPGSCKYINTSSSLAETYIKECHHDDFNEYECRKVVISFRSVETFLRRDCVPKGLCSWKDKTRAMTRTPVYDCVYTNEHIQKLECIYCCDTPLCNRAVSYFMINQFIICFFLMFH